MSLKALRPVLLILLLVTVWLAGGTAWALENGIDDALICAAETAGQEQQMAIPEHLLHAISLVESGRWDAEHKANLAWPWTVDAEGEGRFLPTKEAAIAEVRKLRARGVKNIDVGCMQVNLLAHPDAFASLDEAFDPRSNIAYAAHFLRVLHEQDGNWAQAGAHYHSQTPELAAPYKAKLMSVWDAALHHQNPASVQLASLEFTNQPRLPLGVIFPLAAETHAKIETASLKADPLGRTEQERLAAKRAADAFRQTKLAEYLQKHGRVEAKG